ncbi:hypothetical protein SAMN02910314_01930 [Denitrobacterium detoxificans]|uniref:Uncharacterized protein n=1 Tax=Denitrobacterium detoxificans TaxID=79604 RepID=A0A1H8SSZ5_9ACTN|nr:hypothetical protein SAMN02910314_01306 [Denitrobacterium detoxificans]SEP01709.1 hypothetical protein SAMN02910314_01930 [Denitrobacterium detoxificans]
MRAYIKTLDSRIRPATVKRSMTCADCAHPKPCRYGHGRALEAGFCPKWRYRNAEEPR